MRIFKTENSPVVDFISTTYEPSPKDQEHLFSVKISDLYQQYREYCMVSGYKPKTVANFSRELSHTHIEEFNLSKKITGSATCLIGLRRQITSMGERITYDAPLENAPSPQVALIDTDI